MQGGFLARMIIYGRSQIRRKNSRPTDKSFPSGNEKSGYCQPDLISHAIKIVHLIILTMISRHTRQFRIAIMLLSLIEMPLCYAQNTFELIQTETQNSYHLPIPKGPTSTPQTFTYFSNVNGSKDTVGIFNEVKPANTVTFSFDDQTYLTVPQHITGLTFGASAGFSSNQIMAGAVADSDCFCSDGTTNLFTSHPSGPLGEGIEKGINVGANIFVSAKPLRIGNVPAADTSRYYYGKLTIQFNRPVNNPVISVAGLGASTEFSKVHLGFSTELELLTPSLSLKKLSGNNDLIIDSTATKILHAQTLMGGICETGAACGSVLVKGYGIKKLSFGVYLRADGGMGIWGTEKNNNAGDTWNLMVSMGEQSQVK